MKFISTEGILSCLSCTLWLKNSKAYPHVSNLSTSPPLHGQTNLCTPARTFLVESWDGRVEVEMWRVEITMGADPMELANTRALIAVGFFSRENRRYRRSCLLSLLFLLFFVAKESLLPLLFFVAKESLLSLLFFVAKESLLPLLFFVAQHPHPQKGGAASFTAPVPARPARRIRARAAWPPRPRAAPRTSRLHPTSSRRADSRTT